MNVLWSTGYGVILLVWGLAFELGGLGLVVLVHHAIRQDQRHQDLAAMTTAHGADAEAAGTEATEVELSSRPA